MYGYPHNHPLTLISALPRERAPDGDGSLRSDLEPPHRLIRPRSISTPRALARGGQVVRPLAELRHQRGEGAAQVLSTALLPLQHRITSALQLGPHVVGLQQPELQEGGAGLGSHSAGTAQRRDAAEAHAHQSV